MHGWGNNSFPQAVCVRAVTFFHLTPENMAYLFCTKFLLFCTNRRGTNIFRGVRVDEQAETGTDALLYCSSMENKHAGVSERPMEFTGYFVGRCSDTVIEPTRTIKIGRERRRLILVERRIRSCVPGFSRESERELYCTMWVTGVFP